MASYVHCEGRWEDLCEEEEEEEEVRELEDDYVSSESRTTRTGSAESLQPGSLEVISDLTKLGRTKESLLFIDKSCEGLHNGLPPVHVDSQSAGGAYYLRSEGKICSVFKPYDEEPGTPSVRKLVECEIMRNGIPPGEGYLREVAAYLLDHEGFSGVPPTALVRIYSHAWCRGSTSVGGSSSSYGSMSFESLSTSPDVQFCFPLRQSMHSRLSRATSCSLSTSTKPCLKVDTSSSPFQYNKLGDLVLDSLPSKVGSLQRYVSHHSTAEDIGPSLIPLEMVQKIGVLDIRLLNVDRNPSNVLIQTVDESYPSSPAGRLTRRSESFCVGGSENSLKLIPIDHGLCLPKVTQLSENSQETDADTIILEWMNYPQCKEPFLPSVVQYIEKLDIESDVKLLRTYLPELGYEELLTVRVCHALLLHMVKLKYSLFDIGAVIQSGLLKRMVELARLPSLGEMRDAVKVAQYVERFVGILWEKIPILE